MEMKSPRRRLPEWAKRPLGRPSELHEIKALLRERGLHTVCESARCPNMGECFSKPTATFMILGDVCTRRCGFCGVNGKGGEKGTPLKIDRVEPKNIALTARDLALRHVVVTSVTRDDLSDGGASQFVLTIQAIRDTMSHISVEVLVPDFGGSEASVDMVLDAGPDIFNHNVETVPRLYSVVRPGADYEMSLKVLARASGRGVKTKSGLMAGFGERADEVRSVLSDLGGVGCDAVTIGQYLQPTRDNLEVVEYVDPEVFDEYATYGKEIGIKSVYSGPLVRSSYNAESVFEDIS